MSAAAHPRCQSYRARAFDGCERCRAAALDAVVQSCLYVVASVTPPPDELGDASADAGLTHGGLAGGWQAVGLGLAYSVAVRLVDPAGEPLAEDELTVEQSIETVIDEESAGPEPDDAGAEGDAGDQDGGEEIGAGDRAMSTADFQAIVDRLELRLAAPGRPSGVVEGRLFGFERLVGAFEAIVSPG